MTVYSERSTGKSPGTLRHHTCSREEAQRRGGQPTPGGQEVSWGTHCSVAVANVSPSLRKQKSHHKGSLPERKESAFSYRAAMRRITQIKSACYPEAVLSNILGYTDKEM